MIGRIWRKLTRDQRGVTLTELTVTVTIIGILGAVVATGVGGSTTAANESSRAQLFGAVQQAVDTYAQGHLPPDGDLTKATYPFDHTSATAGTVIFTTFGVPSKDAAQLEAWAWDWYDAGGKFLNPQPGTSTAGGAAGQYTTEAFVYVDLYSGGTGCTESSGQAYGGTTSTALKTDIRCLGFLKVPGASTKAFGTPATSATTANPATVGSVIRCLLVSNVTTSTATDQNTGNTITLYAQGSGGAELHGGQAATGSTATTEQAAKAAVGFMKGKVLACRDSDPGGTKR